MPFQDFTCHYDSPLGKITLASDGEAMTGLWFDGQKHFAETLGTRHEEKLLPIFRQAIQWLDIYFIGKAPDFTPPLEMRTTPFRRTVWEILLTIPFGKTMSYGEIARVIAQRHHLKQMSAQAVGNAVSHNAIALIIPCHRVIGANGSLTGYAGGLERKRTLLALERSDVKLT